MSKHNDDTLHTKSITGRDGYIVAQALYQACKYQEALKDAGDVAYEWSNHQDMKAILNVAYPAWGGLFRMQDTHMKRKPADLNDEKRVEAPDEDDKAAV